MNKENKCDCMCHSPNFGGSYCKNLGVQICDKCGEPMNKEKKEIFINEFRNPLIEQMIGETAYLRLLDQIGMYWISELDSYANNKLSEIKEKVCRISFQPENSDERYVELDSVLSLLSNK